MRPKWTASNPVAAGKVIAQRDPPQMSGGQYICTLFGPDIGVACPRASYRNSFK